MSSCENELTLLIRFLTTQADDHGETKNLSFGFDSLQSSLLLGGHRELCASRLSKTDLRSQLSRS